MTKPLICAGKVGGFSLVGIVSETRKNERMIRHEGQFKPGCKGGPGRPKGSKSRGAELRDTLLDAIEELGKDGKGGAKAFIRDLLEKAVKQSPQSVLKVIASVLPKEVAHEFTGEPLSVIVEYIEHNGDRDPNNQAAT